MAKNNNIIIGRVDGYEVYSTGDTAIPGACERCQDPETSSDQRQEHFACRTIRSETRELLNRGVLSMDYVDGQWETSLIDRPGFEAWRREHTDRHRSAEERARLQIGGPLTDDERMKMITNAGRSSRAY